MRSADFSNAPRAASAGALFVGATRYRGPRSVLHAMRAWPRLIRRLKASPGYCWHTFYVARPFTLGTIALFTDHEAMVAFARCDEHRELMVWATRGNRHATGGFIRVYGADARGYTNGRWRSEDATVHAIEHFTPVEGEDNGPLVDGGA